MSSPPLNDAPGPGPANESGPLAASTRVRRVPFERVKALGREIAGQHWLFEVWLSGAEPGLAGLSEEDAAACGVRLDSDAQSFSFCVNGLTFTAVESAADGHLRSHDFLLERSGNHCDNAFPAVPLACYLDSCQPAALYFEAESEEANRRRHRLLSLQFQGLGVLCVGTDVDEDLFSSFISHFSPELLIQALADFQRREIESQSRPLSSSEAERPPRARL